ncbi:hypothetical protein R5R35_011270 [Gryllus longicercus]|uniref:Transmembrane protein n=1 Tax=Gryllus longicercus TaxID=2509291 RepID=A0AAN9Z455_9ORTH
MRELRMVDSRDQSSVAKAEAADWISKGMEALRQTNQHGKTSQSSGPVHAQQGQGLAALLVMIAVLCFIVAYCCWGAPCCRAFCRRRCCCCHMARDLESASPSDVGLSVEPGVGATPTIILLPYGRMLVVDGSVFAQLQADTSGLDLIELGENVVRAQQQQIRASSTPSILDVDSETTSKGLDSPVSTGMPPPTYESIFGSAEIHDLPPSYDEILRQLHLHRDDDEYGPGEIRESRV